MGERGFGTALKNWKYIILGTACLGLVLAVTTAAVINNNNRYSVQVVPPTCTENGYTVYTDKYSNSTRFDSIKQALGHEFGEWQTTDAATNRRSAVCIRCGTEMSEIADDVDSIPVLRLYGSLDGIAKDSGVSMSFTYRSTEHQLAGYASLKYQGHTSMLNEKRNYTLKLFYDEQCSEKMKLTLAGKNGEHKYILKANYSDPSKIRNLVSADVWSGMVKTRDNLHKRLYDTSNLGAVNGYPVAVYLNDEFHGLYDLTLHKDDDLFLMEDGEMSAILISNEGGTDEALFRKTVDVFSNDTWEIEFCGTDAQKWLKDKFNAFIGFVNTADDEEFKKELSRHVDVDSVIDYMIAMYSLGLYDKDECDIVFVTYDSSPFIASMFDMNMSLGLDRDGKSNGSADFKLPSYGDDGWSSGTDNLLYERVIDNFADRLCERYIQLRGGVLSDDALLKAVEARAAAIPEYIREMELSLYPNTPYAGEYGAEQIKEYMIKRMSLLDEIFAK